MRFDDTNPEKEDKKFEKVTKHYFYGHMGVWFHMV